MADEIMPGQFDSEALTGRCFYRAVASPAVPGQYGYIGLFNPAGSDITTFLDAFGVWPGLPGVAAEVGIIHYATPFNQIPSTTFTGTVPFANCHIGMPQSKTQIMLCASVLQFGSFIDYVMVGPRNAEVQRLESNPYPLIINAGDAIVFWNPTQGYELKVQAWIREL